MLFERDILRFMSIVESMKLNVEKPMNFCIDDKSVVDLAKNWSVVGRTRHCEIKDHFLIELKKQKKLKYV